jgi:hypothetical protein
VEDLDRFLALVGRELGADDVHLRLGGRDPSGPGTVFVELEPGVRLVARFAGRVPDPVDARERMAALARTFDGTVERAARAPRLPTATARRTHQGELTHALDVLAQRTDAAAIVVVDDRSPVVWGHSTNSETALDDVRGVLSEGAAETDELATAFGGPRDARSFLMQAILAARQGEENRLVRTRDGGFAVRRFGGIYRLALAFGAGFSPLHVETSVSKALPAIERLVEGLPPVDPPPVRARVTRLRPV